MVFRHLEILEAVAETGTFTGAAKKLFITQSAVSHAIAELERQAGTELFERLPKGVRLTPCGALLLEEAGSILAACRNLDRRLPQLEENTPVNVVSSITIASFLLPQILNGLKSACPQLRVSVRVASANAAVELLKRGDADVAFWEGSVAPEEFGTIPLGAYRLCAACAPDFAAAQEKLGVRELCRYPLLLREPGSAIRDTFDHMLALHNQKAEPVWESVNSFALIKAAEAGLGITVLPEKLLQDSLLLKKLRVLAVEETEMENRMFALYHKDRYVPKTVRTMLAEISGRKE